MAAITVSRRAQFYLGLRGGERGIFRAAEEPTQASHGSQWTACVGPFRTKRGAEYMRDNPYCRDVADAERRAKEVQA